MARSRVINPRILDSPNIRDFGLIGNYFWIGLLLVADDAGRARSEPILLHSCVNPFKTRELTTGTIKKLTRKLQDLGMIRLYVAADGHEYLEIVNWKRYQKISHPTASKIPPPIDGSNSGKPPETLPKHSGAAPDEEERRGEEGRTGRSGPVLPDPDSQLTSNAPTRQTGSGSPAGRPAPTGSIVNGENHCPYPWLNADQWRRLKDIPPTHRDYWRDRWRDEHGYAFDEPPPGWKP